MAKGGGGQPDQSEGAMGLLWIIAAILVFGGLFWYVFKVQIIHAYFMVKLVEIKFFSLFTTQLQDVQSYILNSDPAKMKFDDVLNVGNAVGQYLRIPVVILTFILAFAIYFHNSTRLFKRTYSMRDLAKLEKVNYPQITPVIGLDLDRKDVDKGPWAMALTPMQFCKKHRLLDEHKVQPREGMTRKEMNRIEVTLRRGQANKIFSMQLGPSWQGFEKLPMHTRALFVAFAAKYHSDVKATEKLLNQLSLSSATKLDYTGVNELYNKYAGNKYIQRVVGSHAYVLTVMAGLLELCREDGVQASADFLWLKPVDRRLWYMLNTVGRQTPFVEVAGPFAHWIAEKQMGRRLLVPMVEQATNALEIALKEIIYQPDETD